MVLSNQTNSDCATMNLQRPVRGQEGHQPWFSLGTRSLYCAGLKADLCLHIAELLARKYKGSNYIIFKCGTFAFCLSGSVKGAFKFILS